MRHACSDPRPYSHRRVAFWKRTAAAVVAILLTAGVQAQTLTGSATASTQMDIEVDASALVERLDAQDARLNAAEAERQQLRQAVEALAQAAPAPALDPSPVVVTPAPANDEADTDGIQDSVAVGFTVFKKTDDTVVYYVASDGNDSNTGLSPDAPLRTAQAGYKKLRNDAADWLLFKAGDTFVGNLGSLTKSGLGPNEPMVFGVYGEGPRPIFLSPSDRWASKEFQARVDFVAFQGLHIIAMHRKQALEVGSAASLTPERWKQSAIGLLGRARHVLIEDCKFEAFKFALVVQSGEDWGYAEKITLRRNIVVDSFGHWDKKIGGHSSGLYAEYIRGLNLEENLWDHNGWADNISGANRTKFNHNIYIQSDCLDVNVNGEIITRGSSFGMQVRPGGHVEDCLFVGNPLAMYVGRNASVVKNNVVLKGIDQEGGGSDGIGINPCLDAVITGNIVSQKAGTFKHGAAIHADWTSNGMKWLGERDFRVSITDNKIYQWPFDMFKAEEAINPDVTETLGMKINKASTLEKFSGNEADNPQWIDPSRDVDRYMASLGYSGNEASFEAFLENARHRQRQQWDPRFSASAVNDYVRAGFELRN